MEELLLEIANVRQSEQKFRTFVNTASDFMYMADEKGYFTFVNESMSRSLAYLEEEIIGMHISQAVKKVIVEEEILKKPTKSMAQGEISIEVEWIGKGGKEIYGEIKVIALYDSEGKFKGSRGVFRDLTERKRAETALQESEKRYRMLVESMRDGLVIQDDGDIITYVNNSFLNMLGYPEQEIIGRSILDFIDGPGASPIQKTRMKHMEVSDRSCEVVLRRKDGLKIPSIISPQPIYDHDRNFLGNLSVVTDITSLKQAENALRLSNEILSNEHDQRKMLSKRLIDFLEQIRLQIAMELHDHIGQNLTSFKMSLEVLRNQLRPSDPLLESQIKAIEEKAVQLLKDVKNISHGLRPSILDAYGLESSLKESFNEIQGDRDIEIHFFSSNVPKRFDREKELAIYRIAQEALSNICKHSRAKNVHVNLIRKDCCISLSVEDDGEGFDQEEIMKTSLGKGPLGLLIMRERAVQLDGELTIESGIGKGTHILAEIPI